MTPLTQKAAGAYYTPDYVADSLLHWAIRSAGDRLLDPSCGDGRFIVGHRNAVGIEQDATAAQEAVRRAPWALVHEGDFYAWAANTAERFECAAGNPPFIRYQTFKGDVRERALSLCARLGAQFNGLASSWAPFLVAATSVMDRSRTMNRFTTTPPTRSSSVRSFGLLRAASAAAASTLAACAGYSSGALQPGSSEAESRARMGEPSGHHALQGGTSKLEFARGPMGKHTYMIELDATGRVRGWQQVLTEANFDSLPITAPPAEVRQQLGRPSETRVGWRGVGEVWSYRFESPFCRWFQVWLVDERVREASYAIDPTCDEARREGD